MTNDKAQRRATREANTLIMSWSPIVLLQNINKYKVCKTQNNQQR